MLKFEDYFVREVREDVGKLFRIFLVKINKSVKGFFSVFNFKIRCGKGKFELWFL